MAEIMTCKSCGKVIGLSKKNQANVFSCGSAYCKKCIKGMGSARLV